MLVKAKFSILGLTKNKNYLVQEIISNTYYKINLDDGSIGIRHKCSFYKN